MKEEEKIKAGEEKKKMKKVEEEEKQQFSLSRNTDNRQLWKIVIICATRQGHDDDNSMSLLYLTMLSQFSFFKILTFF